MISFGEMLRDDARRDVAAAAGRERNDDAHPSLRPLFRLRRLPDADGGEHKQSRWRKSADPHGDASGGLRRIIFPALIETRG
jgi:hypothetical protein